jgi:hypothetical protein
MITNIMTDNVENKPWLKSPHLILTLDQLAKAGELDESLVTSIVEAFNLAISFEGATEVGFSRDSEQSFNPRTARILLILLNDAKVREEEVLKVDIERAALGPAYTSYFELVEPLVVSAAFLLDRLRHLHLESQRDVEPTYLASLKIAEKITTDYPRLSLLLSKSVERMKRNI